MSLKLRNTEVFLTNYVRRLIVLTRQEILRPQTRTYRSKLFGNRTINSPLDSSGDLRNSLRLVKKLKNVVNETGFAATQSYRIVGNAYGEILDEGAGPDKVKATVSGLEKWINKKPVKLEKIKNKKKVAEYMKRKIDRYGIQGTGFLRKLLDKQSDKVFGIIPSITKDISLNLDDILVLLGWDKSGETFTRKI
ncbi:hypothetical protein [uncultured Mediterranean phage uvDeep1-CGR2-KM23-C896]|jgi:hypothetical protein|nr:hypothetical protein [uncultured Mediterranean phage uvDeep1-CGR2-KM23-C896]